MSLLNFRHGGGEEGAKLNQWRYFLLWTLHYYMTTSYTDVELRNSRIRYLPLARFSPLDYLHFVVKKLQTKMQEHVLYVRWSRNLIDSTEVVVTNSRANASWIVCVCLWKNFVNKPTISNLLVHRIKSGLKCRSQLEWSTESSQNTQDG